jgi:predicted nucleic acid-binding protein
MNRRDKWRVWAHLTGRPAEIASKAFERLLTQYAPRTDFADACVVRMSERFAACKVLTLDRADFAIYRRNGREVIPLIAP